MNIHSPHNAKINDFDLFQLFEQLLAFWFDWQQAIEKHYSGESLLQDSEKELVLNVPLYLNAQLSRFINTQTIAIKQYASSNQERLYQKLLYGYAAFIDEQLLQHTQWTEVDNWLPVMLEITLFGSRNAGDKLIDDMESLTDELEKLTDNSANILEDKQVLSGIYLRILWLNFDGKYHGSLKKIERLKKRLARYSVVTMPDFNAPYLSHQPYSCTAIHDEQSRLAPMKHWKKIMAYAVMLYIFITGVAWWFITSPLSDLLIKKLS